MRKQLGTKNSMSKEGRLRQETNGGETGGEHMRKAGEEEDWKKNTIDRGGWNRLLDEAVKKLRQNLTHDKGKKGRVRYRRPCQHLSPARKLTT